MPGSLWHPKAIPLLTMALFLYCLMSELRLLYQQLKIETVCCLPLLHEHIQNVLLIAASSSLALLASWLSFARFSLYDLGLKPLPAPSFFLRLSFLCSWYMCTSCHERSNISGYVISKLPRKVDPILRRDGFDNETGYILHFVVSKMNVSILVITDYVVYIYIVCETFPNL